MNTKDKLFQLAKRFREISKLVRDADFKLCEWSRDLRAEYPAGTAGDEAFVRWCGDELGVTDGEARFDLLPRAAAFAVAPDLATWSEIGGYRAARKLSRLPRKEQVACIGAMKASGYGVDKIMRDRGHGPKPIGTPKLAAPTNHDAEVLARFIADTLKSVPPKISAVVSRYVKEPVP